MRLVCALGAVALVTACGSTVQLQNRALVGAAGDGQSLGAAASGQGASASTSSSALSNVGTAQVVQQGPGASAAAGGTGTSTGSSVVPSSLAPKGPVEVGFFTESSDTALAGGLGLSGVSNGNEPGYMQAVVADVNAHGGILGRKVKPIEYRLDPTTTEDFSTVEEEACNKFVADNHAVAALTAFHLTAGQTLTSCMEQHHAATINPTGYDSSGSADYARFPHYFTPPGLVVEHQASAYVDGVNRLGFFQKGARIGLISVDYPTFHAAVDHSLKPALSKLGLSLYDAEYYPEPNRTSDIGPTANSIASAELKFAAEGITEVLFLESGALGVYEFARAASSQQYHPRYAISTTDAPAGLIGLGTPADQLANMVGVGWMPEVDVSVSQMGVIPAPMARCQAVMKKAGLASTDNTEIGVQLEYCEELWFLKAAVEAGGGFAAEQIRVGTERLAGTFASPQTPVTLFGADRHDGVDSIRPLRYETGCACFRYVGPLSRLS